MALNFGNNTPSSYYVGSSAVSEMFFGDTKVWPVAAPTVSTIKIFGNSSAASYATNISASFVEFGFTAPPTITTEVLSSTTTGADLSPSAYSVVIVYTDGGAIGASSFATNLKTYMTNGGRVVFNTFVGTGDSLNPGGASFDVALLPFTTKAAGQGNFPITTLTVNSAGHPILNGVSNGASIGTGFYTAFTSAQVRAGATLVGSLGTLPFIATHTYGATARCVYYNLYIAPYMYSAGINANARRLVVNSLLWAVGSI